MRLILFLVIPVLVSGCGNSRTTSGRDGGAGSDGGGGGDGGGTSCSSGEQYFVPGCGSGEDVTITAGCYLPCMGAGDFTTCASPLVCQRTDINPCICGPGEGCCAACGSEQWLCLAWDAGDTEPYELSSLDEVCEELLSGQDLLDSVNESYTATLTYTADSSTTELELRFVYDAGRLICHPPIPAPPGSGAPDLPAYLEVEVGVSVSTADGQFDETGTTLLSTGVSGTSVSFNATFAVPDLRGTYVPQRSDLTEHAVWFAGNLSTESASGMAMEGGTRAGGVGEVLPVGAWSWP